MSDSFNMHPMSKYPPRPEFANTRERNLAARYFLSDQPVFKEMGDHTIDDVADLLSKSARHMTGFELAKELESHGWIVDSKIVAALEGWKAASVECDEKAIKDWVKNNRVSQPYPHGTYISCPNGLRGTIKTRSVYSLTAEYFVKLDGQAESSTFKVRFEDATPVESEVAL